MITERKFDVGEWAFFGDEKAHESSPDRFPQAGTKGQVLATRGESVLVQWPNGSTDGDRD